MKQTKIFALTLAGVLAFALAYAKEGFSQAELNAKHGLAVAEAKKRMEEVLAQISKEYSDDPVFLEKLRDAQEAWIAFSEKE